MRLNEGGKGRARNSASVMMDVGVTGGGGYDVTLMGGGGGGS